MNARAWLWFGTALDAGLFLLGAFAAESAVEVASEQSGSLWAVAIAALFIALPVFCLATPGAAWRAYRKKRSPAHVAGLFAMPFVYALFLMGFFILL